MALDHLHLLLSNFTTSNPLSSLNLQLLRSTSLSSVRLVSGHAHRKRLITIKPRFAFSPPWRNPFPVTGQATVAQIHETLNRTSSFLFSLLVPQFFVLESEKGRSVCDRE